MSRLVCLTAWFCLAARTMRPVKWVAGGDAAQATIDGPGCQRRQRSVAGSIQVSFESASGLTLTREQPLTTRETVPRSGRSR